MADDLETAQQEELGSQFGVDANAPHPGFFGGLGEGGFLGKGVAQALLYGAAAAVHGANSGIYMPIPGTNRLKLPTDDRPDQDKESDWEIGIRKTADSFRPDPYTAGTAYQTLQGLFEFATKMEIGHVTRAPGGAMASTAGITYYEQYHNYLDQGVDSDTAASLARGDSAVSALFAGIPGVVGALSETTRLARKVKSVIDLNEADHVMLARAETTRLARKLVLEAATGVGSNVPLGMANRYADHQILDEAGYHDMADQQLWNDGAAILTDMATGLIPAVHEGAGALLRGSVGHIRDALAEPGLARDAKDVINHVRGIDQTAPGAPVDAKAQVFHREALRTAQEQDLAGEPIDLSKADLPDSATFVKRNDDPDMRTAVIGAFTEHLQHTGFLDELMGLDNDNQRLLERVTGEKSTEPVKEPEAEGPKSSLDLSIETPISDLKTQPSKAEEMQPAEETKGGDFASATPEELAAHTAEVSKPLVKRLKELVKRLKEKKPKVNQGPVSSTATAYPARKRKPEASILSN
jgi:hypothetical protein